MDELVWFLHGSYGCWSVQWQGMGASTQQVSQPLFSDRVSFFPYSSIISATDFLNFHFSFNKGLHLLLS